jgi:arylsulfatase
MSAASRARRPAAAALLAAAAALLAAAGGCAEPERRDWNVIVLLADTLRADHLGAYGYPRPTSPNLDAFAAENVLFAGHRSQSPCTFPSVNSILTSRSPQRFTGRERGVFDIPADVPALAGILQARGYATLAVSASPIVRATPTDLNKVGGFDRGFDLFLERCMWRPAACVHTDFFTYLPVLRRPFFLYLHYMDTHAPYRQPSWYQKRFFTDYQGGKSWVRAGNPKPIERRVYEGVGDAVEEADLRGLIDLYDDSIGFLDEQFALLLRTLGEAGALDNTLIAVIADHGESFLEHDHMLHCRTLYDPEIKVPWLMRVPGIAGPVRIAGPTANLDVVPTILDLLGEDLTAFEFEGTSRRPAIERGRPVTGTVFATWGGLDTATDGRHKLITHRESATAKLYDLVADPGEEHDVAAARQGELRRLAAELAGWRRAVGEGGAAAEGEGVEEQLRALGYLQ